jgi:hypothetical protein
MEVVVVDSNTNVVTPAPAGARRSYDYVDARCCCHFALYLWSCSLSFSLFIMGNSASSLPYSTGSKVEESQ